jgi:precorrin-6B methylase 2
MNIVISSLFFLIMVYLISLIWTNTHGAPWVPTSREVINIMLTMAEIKPGEIVYDLGSGDGRVLIAAARRFDARAVGVEMDVSRYLWSVAAVSLLGLRKRVRIIRGDFFKIDLSKADVVFAYLLQNTNDRLKDKLRDELRPGTRLISNTFTFSGLPLVLTDEELKLYLYKIT